VRETRAVSRSPRPRCTARRSDAGHRPRSAIPVSRWAGAVRRAPTRPVHRGRGLREAARGLPHVHARRAWCSAPRILEYRPTGIRRNLHTWTNYTGYDPETNLAGRSRRVAPEEWTISTIRRRAHSRSPSLEPLTRGDRHMRRNATVALVSLGCSSGRRAVMRS